MAAIWKFFNDISRTESQTELKLDGRYPGDMEIQNCSIRSVSISKMAAIWKFFNDISRTENWIQLILDGRYRTDMEIKNCSIRSVLISKMVAILKFFKRHLNQDRFGLRYLMGGIRTTWRFRIAKVVSFR